MPISRRLASAVLTVALALTTLVAAPASAAETRTISGTVTVPSTLASKWRGHIHVVVNRTSDGSSVAYGNVNATTGEYSIANLSPGVYQVVFSSTGIQDANGVYEYSPLITEVYDNVKGTYAGYTPVDVTSANATGINAALEIGASIKGKVTVPSGTAAGWYKGVTVSAGNAFAWVKADGTYSINGLLPGTYKVGASVQAYWPAGASTSVTPQLIGEYWSEKRDHASATSLSVPSAGKTGINFTLEKSFSMSGTVSLPAGADLAQLASVSVRLKDSTGWTAYGTLNPTTGAWTAKNLYAGTYTVEFTASQRYWHAATSTFKFSDVLGEFYNNAATASAATKVTISTANRTGINATLDVGDGISGTVSLPEDAPAQWLHGVLVYAITADGTRILGSHDGETGEYRISKLRPGTYRVLFSVASSVSVGGGPSFSPGLASEYYSNAYTLAEATPVTISRGTSVTGINATMEPTITVADGPRIQWYEGTSGLRAVPGTWTPTPTSLAYQWFRAGVEIPGANSDIYMLSDSDRGSVFKVRVSGRAPGYGLTAKEYSVTVPRLSFATTPVPSISGTARSGYTLTAKAGTWSPSATLKYQWYKGTAKISGATKSTYKVQTADRGSKITVQVTGSRTGYTSTTMTSDAKTILREFTTVPTPKITGTLRAGKTLTAVRGTWKPTPAYSYQWYRNGVAIKGATKYQYKLTTADKGKVIKVKVIGKKTGYVTTTKTSAGKTIAR